MNAILVISGFILSLIINFLPTIIAFCKKNHNKFNILLLNGIPYAISVLLILTSISTLDMIIDILNIILWIVALIKTFKN